MSRRKVSCALGSAPGVLTAPTRLCGHAQWLLCALWPVGSRPEGGWYLFLLLLNI